MEIQSPKRCDDCGAMMYLGVDHWCDKKPHESSRTPAPPAVRSGEWVGELEAALRLINEAEGCMLIGKLSRGMVLLADGKGKLERIVNPERRRSAKTEVSYRASLGTFCPECGRRATMHGPVYICWKCMILLTAKGKKLASAKADLPTPGE